VDHSSEIIEVPCDKIRIGDRHRKDMGDLEVLAESIASVGLLQPIGITEDYTLVFGERRLLAVRDILQQETISARVVRVNSILEGEYAENEIRKDFTPSERVAIAKAIEEAIGKRQGQRTDRGLPRNCAEVAPGTETRELAAQKAGFGSKDSYERARRVVERGEPELVAAMDRGEVSISAAAVIAEQPKEKQREIVTLPEDKRREIVRQLRKAVELPTTAEARRIARETGMLVADRTGRYRSGHTPEERAAIEEELDEIWDLTRAVITLADAKADPVALAKKLEYWHCGDIRMKSPKALAWLQKFEEAIRERTDLT